MKAMKVVRPRSFEPVQIPVPQLPPEGEDCLLVRPSWVSLCGSDVPFFTGHKQFAVYPLLPGAPIHECVGEVVESASGLFRPGDRVLSIPDEDRGLAEFFLAQASRTVAVNCEIEDPGAACLIQPLSTVLNAMDRLGDIRGKTVAVVGLGSIGLMFCWLSAKGGASSIVGIDPCEARCRFAGTFGATQTVCHHGIEVVHGLRAVPSSWNPPDICIEAVGHQMETINDCLELVRNRGTVVAFGVPDHTVYAFEYERFFRKNAVLMGTVTPDWKKYLAKSQDVFLASKNELSNLVTHRLPIREAAKAFRLYEKHENGILKAILDASDW